MHASKALDPLVIPDVLHQRKLKHMKFVKNEKPETKVDKKSQELIHEFQSHYEEIV